MKRSPWAGASVAGMLALASAAVGFSACSATSSGDTCDCPTSLITIDVPADIASAITTSSIHLTGVGCPEVSVTCANMTNGCTQYDFNPTAPGECDLEIDEPATTFTATLTIVAQTGCCSASLTASTTTIDVPEPGDGG